MPRTNLIKPKIFLIVIIYTLLFNAPVFSKQSNQQSLKAINSLYSAKTEELNNINQKYNELIKESENIKSNYSSLKSIVNEKCYKLDEISKENNKLNNRIADITKTYEMDKENYLEEMENKFNELELAKCKILELTARINQLENYQVNNNSKKGSRKKDRKTFVDVDDFDTSNKKDAIENYRKTVLGQSKQLTKCNTEIDKISNKVKKYDNLIDNILLKSKKLAAEGKKHEASMLLTSIIQAEIDRPEIYIEIINLYESMGLKEEANKVRVVMYNLYPSLKRENTP